jgi:2-oxoisovalerate dehydrogenase E1 component
MVSAEQETVSSDNKSAVFLELYRSMIEAREVDTLEEELVTRGEAFFTVSGAGHEGSVALNPYLTEHDWLHCHYRDKALMLSRGVTSRLFMQSVLCKGDGHSAGRQMSAHLSDPAHHVLSLSGPVGNSALQAAGVAGAVKNREGHPIVLCSMGDGTSQQGEVLEAIGEAVRWQLPVLFLVEDNAYSISVPTPGMTFFSTPDGAPETFYGLPLHHVNGWDLPACHALFGTVVAEMRQTRKPAIVIMKTERLANHTNADDQTVYREETEISNALESGDPITHLTTWLVENGVELDELEDIRRSIAARVRRECEETLEEDEPEATAEAARPLAPELIDPANEYRGTDADGQLTMLEAIRGVLRHRLDADDRVWLYGEDIGDPKGDVFGVTRGLSTAHPDRVINSPLAEATIVGVSIGRALAGQRPVAFLQFADFLPIAFNQIVSELGSMYWRTDGGWECPVIIMITCGGYRPGLGPFHAQTLESVAAHTPGVDVVMPYTAADAAGLLNTAFESGRPTLFFYPKNCLNDREQTTSPDVVKQIVPLGRARIAREGTDISLIGWGNTVAFCLEAATHLGGAGISAEVLDLRSMAPWDREAVIRSAEKTGRVLVAHEDNHTCGFGAEVLSTIAEAVVRPLVLRRVTRADTYVPFNFGNQLEVLPSTARVLAEAAEMCDLDLSWEMPSDPANDNYVVEALGSSPADESMEVTSWKVEEGATVETGDLLAEIDADKATVELTAPVSGVVRRILVGVGIRQKVGTPIMEIEVPSGVRKRTIKTTGLTGTPILKPRRGASTTSSSGGRVETTVAVALPALARSSRIVTNEELAVNFESQTADDIRDRTGIEERRWVAEGEDALSLAVDAARRLLKQESLDIRDLDLVICSTGTPQAITPSMACAILGTLTEGDDTARVQAYDINAACSGYLYALQSAYDYLQSQPRGKVMIVTTEVLSPYLNRDDFDTSIIFGDAASATLLGSLEHLSGAKATVRRPILSAEGDIHSRITVPFPGSGGYVGMDGRKVFVKAVRCMSEMLIAACEQSAIRVEDLDMIVSHQANQRIIDAIQKRVRLPKEKLYTNIRKLGNTSSTSIPQCLNDILATTPGGQHFGLCAFGGGFTFGAGILKTVD